MSGEKWEISICVQNLIMLLAVNNELKLHWTEYDWCFLLQNATNHKGIIIKLFKRTKAKLCGNEKPYRI